MRIVLVAILLSACGKSRDTTVRFNLQPLQQHAKLLSIEVSSLTLKLSATDLETVSRDIDPQALSFELQVEGGPARNFLVQATSPNGSEDTPSYWGQVAVDLAPRTTVDLAIPTFPAGEVLGALATPDGTAVPDGVVVTFTNTDPQNGRPSELSAASQSTAFRRTLPTGTYKVEARLVEGEQTYKLSDDFVFSVTHAAAVDLGTLLLLPPNVAPPSPAPLGIPNGGLNAAQNVGAGTSGMRSPNHTLTTGSLGTNAVEVMSSPSYKLHPTSAPIVHAP